MLRVVKRTFEAEHGIILLPGDIVDVSGWKHAESLKDNGYLGDTKAEKATVDVSLHPKYQRKEASTASASAKGTPAAAPRKRVKKSALASRPRIFRKA